MDANLLSILTPLVTTRDWQHVYEKLSPRLYSKYKNKDIYAFYSTLTDSLEKNPSSIAVWVHAVDSYAPLHVHNYVELTIPLIGECFILTKNEEILVSQNNIFIAGNHMVHTVKPVSKNSLVICIGLKSSAFNMNEYNNIFTTGASNIFNLMFSSFNNEFLSSDNYMLFETNNDDRIKYNINDIIWEYYNSNSQSNHIIHNELLILLARLIRIESEKSLVQTNKDSSATNILTLLLYIEKNYNDITLVSMAKEFGYNANYLTEYLKKHTGKTFIQLVQLQRVNVAAEFLTYTDAKVEQISIEVGYNNPSHFYKIFRKYFQISPKEYREKNRKTT